MGLVRGRGRGKGRGGVLKSKNRGPAVKPPALLGRPAPLPPMALRPRGLPVPPLLPRMRPPPLGLRLRSMPHIPPPMLRPGRAIPPPFHQTPPPLHPHVLSLPPPMPLRPPMPPQSLLRSRGPLRSHGVAYGAPLPLRGKFGGKRGGGNIGKGAKRKGNPMNNESTEVNFGKDGKLYCETCDRSFHSVEALTEHLSQHQTCGLDGCRFTAHATVVMRHVEMQHSSGLYSKISAISDKPEDIAKWITERKKRYPTRENIAKQSKEREERMKRGERLEEDKSRFNSDFSGRRGRHHDMRGAPRGRGKRFVNRADRTTNEIYNKPSKMKRGPYKTRMQASAVTLLSEDEENKNRRLPAFLGTVAFSNENGETEGDEEEEEKKFSDDEWDLSQENKAEGNDGTNPTVSVSKALSNIMGMYASGASDSEEEDSVSVNQAMKIKGIVKDAANLNSESVPGVSGQCSSKAGGSTSASGPSVVNDSDGSGPEEVPIIKSADVVQPADKQPEHQATDSSNKRKRKRVHRNKSSKHKLGRREENESDIQKPVQAPRQKNMPLRRRRLTLLEKLLSREIRHERNVILQCVRHTVNENFFGVADSAQKSQEEKGRSSEEQSAEKQKSLNRILRNIETLRQCNHFVVENNFFGVSCSDLNNSHADDVD